MAEPTVIQCPSCGARFQVAADQLGRTFSCATCKQPFQATAIASEAAAASVAYATPAQFVSTEPGKTSGIAIASLVCGILGCLWPVTPIAALVLGIVGINKTSKPNVRGKGIAIAGTVLGGVFLLLGPIFLLMISILLPSLNKARETANRAKCASNMHQIGLALMMYQNDNKQAFPPDLATLWKNEQLTGAVFVCPSSNDTPASDPSQLNVGGHLSYTYVPPASTYPDATMVILYENGADHHGDGTNILFGDGHAEWFNAANAKTVIAKSLMMNPSQSLPDAK